MKILMLTLGCGESVTGTGYVGGAELGAKRLARKLEELGMDLFVIGNGGDLSFSLPKYMWRICWPIVAFMGGFFYLLLNDVDVIYSRFATFPLFVGSLLKLCFGKKLVVSIHGRDIRHEGLSKRLITLCLRYCDKVVCYDNDEHIEELRHRGIEPIVIPNGIDDSRFKLDKISLRQPSFARKRTVLYLGGEREIKGFRDMLYLSFNKYVSSFKNISFNIYSNKDYASASNFIFYDPIPNNMIETVMETGQLFILPSHEEGFPSALLEAMASGMFVIASDLPTTRKLLDKKFLFKVGDLDRMRDLIVRFRDSRSSYFGKQYLRNRSIVLKDYSINKTAKMWKDLFEGVING
jgi:glycosyltransferase involved in cell wall biosynthesis